jgi:hypothetical protein
VSSSGSFTGQSGHPAHTLKLLLLFRKLARLQPLNPTSRAEFEITI